MLHRLTARLPKPLRLKYGVLALVAFLVVTGAIAAGVRSLLPHDAKALQLAVAAPLTGTQALAGKEMVQSIQLYLDSVNQTGGINGQPLKLLVFDDQGDPKTARQLPQQVARSASLVALGHLSSATASEAAPLYKTLQMPVITGTASEDYITQANPYAFRTVFTNSVQGSVVALYMQQALKFKTASIISTDDRLGQSLDEAFEATFKREGTLKHRWQFDPNAPQAEALLTAIVKELATDPNPGMVFLAMDAVPATDFIVAIRRRGLKTPLFSSQSLVGEAASKRLQSDAAATKQADDLLDGIYVPASLLFDSAGADAQEFASLYQRTYGD